jgi:ABC-type multidrug transport system fused ATPase/permease subunit
MNIYYLIIAVAPILGYIAATQRKETPAGLLKMNTLSDVVSENPSWHLPIVVLGMFFSFLFNVGIYSIHFIKIILDYIGFIFKWIYDKIILPIGKIIFKIIVLIVDVLLLILRLLNRYFINIPIEIFLSVIKSVSPVVKWSSYFRSLKVIVLGFTAYAILEFLGHLFDLPLIGKIGGPFCIAISITWVVGLVSFDSHLKGKKAAFFATSVICLILLISGFVFGPNQLTLIHGWSGVITGLLYAPSVLGIVSIFLLTLTVLFITNVGVIYVNTIGESESFTSRIKGVVKDAFSRCWYFLWQPVFVVLIGLIISLIPYYLTHFSNSNLQTNIIDPILQRKDGKLNEMLELNTLKLSLMNDSLTDQEFKACLDTIKTKNDLQVESKENKRYREYFKSNIPLRSVPVAVLSNSKLKEEISKLKEEKSELRSELKKALKELKSELKDIQSYGDAAELARKNKQITRTKQHYNVLISSKISEISFVESCKTKYNLTYILILLGKAILFSVVLTLLINLYGYSVLPIYQMHSKSYFASEIKSANEKDRLQPWVGMFLIALIMVAIFFSSGYKNIFNSLTELFKTENVKSNISEIKEKIEPKVEAEKEIVEEVVAPPTDDSDVENYYFNCADGTIINNYQVNDGICDCPDYCDDEQMGD